MKTTIKKIYKNNKKPHESYEHCLACLGEWESVNALADFYKTRISEIDIIVANLITDYALKQEYTSEKMNAYRDGVLAFADFLKSCKIEQEIRNNKVKENEEDNIRT